MADEVYGAVIDGDPDQLKRSYEAFAAQPIDQEYPPSPSADPPRFQTTIAKPVSVTGPGTFFGKATRTLNFEPCEEEGWWIDRSDLPDSLPFQAAIGNIWTTARNLVLCSGSPHNYLRMAEHIIALRLGLGLDNMMIRTNSGDPPLFDRSSMDLVEAMRDAGTKALDRPVRFLTVREPVAILGPNGSFLSFLPSEPGSPNRLTLDCAVDFKSAIGKQRIIFDVTPESFTHGAFARTNTSLAHVIYALTVGKLFADTRNLGYTARNVLIAGPRSYLNDARMEHEGKSLEAAWHRATLDLLAAVALIEKGRFAGRIMSYKAGHTLDVLMIKRLYQNGLLVPAV